MKKHLPLAAALVLALASLSLAQEPSPLLKRLSEMETKLWDAWKNKDPKPFDMHLSADTVLVGDQGVSGKATIAKDITSMACEVKSFTLSDWKLTQYDANHALITYKGAADGTCMGTPIPTTWSSSLWVKRKGAWQAAFHQETPIK